MKAIVVLSKHLIYLLLTWLVFAAKLSLLYLSTQAFTKLSVAFHDCTSLGLHNLLAFNDYNHLLLPCWLMVSFSAFDHPSQTQSTLHLHERMHAIM